MPREKNKPCQCGSGLKYKWCHGDKDMVSKSLSVARLVFMCLVADKKVAKKLMTPYERDAFLKDVAVPTVLKMLDGTRLSDALYNEYAGQITNCEVNTEG